MRLFQPTEAFKNALSSLQCGTIIWISEGPTPNQELCRYEIITQISGENIFLGYGNDSLRKVIATQRKITSGSCSTKENKAHEFFIAKSDLTSKNPSLKVNCIREVGKAAIYRYPSMGFYYGSMVGSGVLVIGLLFLFPLTSVIILVAGLMWLSVRRFAGYTKPKKSLI